MEVRKNLKAIPSRELTYPAFEKGHFILVSKMVFWGRVFPYISRIQTGLYRWAIKSITILEKKSMAQSPLCGAHQSTVKGGRVAMLHLQRCTWIMIWDVLVMWRHRSLEGRAWRPASPRCSSVAATKRKPKCGQLPRNQVGVRSFCRQRWRFKVVSHHHPTTRLNGWSCLMPLPEILDNHHSKICLYIVIDPLLKIPFSIYFHLKV